MNQGGVTGTLSAVDPILLEKHPVGDPNQAHVSYYAQSSAAPTWTTYGVNNNTQDSAVSSNSTYQYNQQAELAPRSVQEGLSSTPIPSTSSSGVTNAPQDYSSYSTYQNANQYGYGNTGYAPYYNGYQQQTTQSYPQTVGAYQNSGAPYQPLSSFQNTGSYPASASYSSTYYNPADYQTSGSYQSDAYSNQTNYWQEGQYTTYASHQYPNYPQDPTTSYSSTNSAATSQYAQHYKQWADYYSQAQTEVSCAPGTENVSVPPTTLLPAPVPAVNGGYQPSQSLPPPPYIPPWRPESTASELPAAQPGPVAGTVSGGTHGAYWKSGPAVFQNQNPGSVQQHYQTSLDTSSPYVQNQQTPTGYTTPYMPSHQVSQSYQSPLPSVSQAVPQLDSSRVSGNLQIPTNPRIALNLGQGLSKVDISSSAASKPAYISVSLTKPNEKVKTEDKATDSLIKPGMFPKSLCGYVERALSRCRGDAQMAACQAVMKEIIKKATEDGTLNTKNWDIEPLFTLPSASTTDPGVLPFSTPSSSLPKGRRSPSRRTKSRWEPVSDETPADKPTPIPQKPVNYGGWHKQPQQFSGGKFENRANQWKNPKYVSPDQKSSNKNVHRVAKRQRLHDGHNGADNADVSSDSDKEQSLTAYYSSAIALSDSPEEKRRRESRSKRFEKGNGNRGANSNLRPKNAGIGSLYSKRASASVPSRNFEDNSSQAVEDIDWDSLTVRGTCQEVEKRYLRLTSAPDPASVRPEEVLEKALLMVQNSERNYLYKCDQLKSIRQDLTVQRIRNELTVKVYETHARFAIEVGDLSEFNQCQSQLKTLYAEGIKGCHLEFVAYNLLCVILHSNNNRDLLSAMSRLPAEARKDDAVRHALAVRGAVTSGNYVLFFRLYKEAPNLNTHLMDLYVEKMRFTAVKCISRSYRPTVPVVHIAQVLGFSSSLPTSDVSHEKELDGVEECVEWLKAHGACLTKDNSGEMLDTKVSMSTLFMPEPEDAVSHGDAYLAVDDFLAKTPNPA